MQQNHRLAPCGPVSQLRHHREEGHPTDAQGTDASEAARCAAAGDIENLIDEAADVANLAMMLWANAKAVIDAD
jgi:hypothetical protein